MIDKQGKNSGVGSKLRAMSIWARLAEGKSFNREEMANYYHCSVRSIQRDLDAIKNFLDIRNTFEDVKQELVYDRNLHSYRLEPPIRQYLSKEEAFGVIKILLDSGTLLKEEMKPIVDKLFNACVAKTDQSLVHDLIASARKNYAEPEHQKKLLQDLWFLEKAAKGKMCVQIVYRRKNGEQLTCEVKPVGIYMDNYHFYLLACVEKEAQLTATELAEVKKHLFPYRVDRIEQIQLTHHYTELPPQLLTEAQLHQDLPRIFDNNEQKIKFSCDRRLLDFIFHCFPQAKLVEAEADRVLVETEAAGVGMSIWLLSMGEDIEISK